MDDDNWLDEEQVQDKIRENEQARLAFARNYEVFITDPRGKAIMEHWDKIFTRKRTPVGATIQEYAADEAIRAFIHAIHDQIELAQTRRE